MSLEVDTSFGMEVNSNIKVCATIFNSFFDSEHCGLVFTIHLLFIIVVGVAVMIDLSQYASQVSRGSDLLSSSHKILSSTN